MMDGAVINCGATLGRGAIVNTNSTVEHDVVLADWVHGYTSSARRSYCAFPFRMTAKGLTQARKPASEYWE